MKSFILLAVMLMTTSAFAVVPSYNARSTSCSDLQQALENYGEINVRAKNILMVRHVRVAENPRCHALAYKREARFRTADSISCQVGFTCEEDRSLRGDCYPGNNPSRCQ